MASAPSQSNVSPFPVVSAPTAPPARSRALLALGAAAALALSLLGARAAQDATPSTRPNAAAPTTSPSTRSATRPRVIGATTVPAWRDLRALSKPFTGTTRPAVTRPSGVAATPDTLEEIRSLERQVEELTRKVLPATVALQIGGAAGSGVIISPDGWILTAGHVNQRPDQPVTIILHDGRRVRGVTGGANRGVDSGLVRLLDPGPWPYCEIGESGTLKAGEWLVAIGHPGGYRVGRAPVVRLGRLTAMTEETGVGRVDTLTTDNTLVGGDSGGPLFDLAGRVVGINSRIAANVTVNKHVPSDEFIRDWDRLAAGDVWPESGGFGMNPNARVPWFGLDPENVDDNTGVRVRGVTDGGPAERAGLRTGDVIHRVNGVPIRNTLDLQTLVRARRPGEILTVEIRREGAEDQSLRVRLGEPRGSTTRRTPRNR